MYLQTGAVHVGNGVDDVTVTVGDEISAPTHWSFASTLAMSDGSSMTFSELMLSEGAITGTPSTLTLSVCSASSIAYRK